jgi:hypothetical protein
VQIISRRIKIIISHRALPIPKVVIGVDTHKDQHVAVMINKLGVQIGRFRLPTTDKGYAALEQWAKSQGEIEAFGIEGTGSYGAGLTRFLMSKGYKVVEVNRPNRSTQGALYLFGVLYLHLPFQNRGTILHYLEERRFSSSSLRLSPSLLI